jgi:hypothetical protein
LSTDLHTPLEPRAYHYLRARYIALSFFIAASKHSSSPTLSSEEQQYKN